MYLCSRPTHTDVQVEAVYQAVEKKNPGQNKRETYETMPHGWLAARADVSYLSDASA